MMKHIEKSFCIFLEQIPKIFIRSNRIAFLCRHVLNNFHLLYLLSAISYHGINLVLFIGYSETTAQIQNIHISIDLHSINSHYQIVMQDGFVFMEFIILFSGFVKLIYYVFILLFFIHMVHYCKKDLNI